ncbi:helix-turn-helix domain-containing protein [Flavobacterium caeni]|uniref:Helix-turn-helix domain-containing protein n=1 Tax=Flavobacterium caeni TaxID=490189 RepID=A0A1G5K6W7_9FLAO|nr:helix-turn-helix domain-containing protein [Flavobacterium caeni]SCY96353.1 Helix-turn-helix domain-containing protein [Flavobacterium caeni]
MAVEILTKQDLNEFRTLLLNDFRELLQTKPQQTKQWLKSSEVRKLLNISPGTLQTLRINKTLSYTKIGGIIYYANQDIEKLLEQNTVKSERTLFNSK